MASFVNLTSADGFVLPAYVAEPAGKPRGAIVVVQEIFGVNSHIREVAEGYAANGYLAVAPAIYHRLQHNVELGYSPEDIQAGAALKARTEALPAPGVMQDLQAAVDYAAKTSGGKVGIVGYCYGGLLSWRAASQLSGVSAAAPYYGGGSTVGAELQRQPKVPVLAHFGRRDAHITMDTVEAFTKAQPAVEVQVYEADHGFNCDHRGSYDAAAAKLALERTLAFFDKHLTQS